MKVFVWLTVFFPSYLIFFYWSDNDTILSPKVPDNICTVDGINIWFKVRTYHIGVTLFSCFLAVTWWNAAPSVACSKLTNITRLVYYSLRKQQRCQKRYFEFLLNFTLSSIYIINCLLRFSVNFKKLLTREKITKRFSKTL